MNDEEIKDTLRKTGSAAIREDLIALRDKINAILAEHPVNIHSGYSPNMWVEQDPRDKAKNLKVRL